MLLSQRRVWHRRVLEDSLIVAKHVCRSLYGRSKHSDLVAKRLDLLHCSFHRYKLTAKGTRFHRVLSFTIPNNWGSVNKYENASLRRRVTLSPAWSESTKQ